MDNEAQAEQAAPQIEARIRTSFDRQGLMRHLGARLGHIGPGRVHIVWGPGDVRKRFHRCSSEDIAESSGGAIGPPDPLRRRLPDDFQSGFAASSSIDTVTQVTIRWCGKRFHTRGERD